MYLDEITQKFLDSPAYLKNGAGFLARVWGCNIEDVYEAKKKARSLGNVLDSMRLPSMNETTEEHELNNLNSNQAIYTGSETTDEGVTKKFESNHPLTPTEIEGLAGVDGINTYVARVWDKLLANGKWIYSIDIRYRVKDFYSKEELREKLSELINVKPINLPRSIATETATTNISAKSLVISLADDHVGAINVTNLFDNEDLSYADRLGAVLYEVLELRQFFDEVHIISLGDQMNGWSSQTTRGGHEVKSKSNKEQFDEYVSARIDFYNKLFTSRISETYFVHDVENSNHSGLGMSYMANQAISLYLGGAFPQVIQESVTDIIGGFQYGEHVIIFGHGKDEKFQKRPMPATLNAQTDLYLYDFLNNKGYSPYTDTITFYKGDLHQMGIQNGKFGRYVNVQSLAGNSDYGDLNFGNTKGGALLEVLDRDSYRVTTIPIWF